MLDNDNRLSVASNSVPSAKYRRGFYAEQFCK